MTKKLIAASLLLITPLVFAPFTLNFFSINKNLFVILMALGLLIMTGLKLLTQKKYAHRPSFFSWSLIIFWVMMAINIWLTREARVESLVDKGALLLTLPVISYLLATAKKSFKTLRFALMAAISTGTILALHGILQLALFSQLTSLPIWMQNLSFTPAGSVLTLITTIVFTLIVNLVWAVKEQRVTIKATLFTTAGIQLAALIAYGFVLYQGNIAIQLLPLKAGWSLTLDALKNVRELFLGIGLANFPVLFTQFKPVFLTQTDLWNVVFQANSNEMLQLLATTGILGFSSFVLVLIATFKASLKLDQTPLNLALRLATYATIASFFLIPGSIITYTFFFVLAGLIAANNPYQRLKVIELPNYSNLVVALLLAGVTLFSGYFTYRVYASEVSMRQAQLAFAENDAEGVYAAHIAAVQYVPQMASYHASLAQINLTLASSITQNQVEDPQTGEVTELTDQQREQISVLIQRAIEQGQATVQLRPSLYSSWQNLGGIYRNLINVAEGAENFAVQYLGQAVAKDPVNPILRIEYGGLFYQLAQLIEDPESKTNALDQAVQQFQVAVQLRPNYANAYYNLAYALDKKGSYRLAYQTMTQVLANIEPDSVEYEQVQQELLVLEEKLPKIEAADSQAVLESESSTLQQPAPLPSPLPGGPIELPQPTATPLPESEDASSSSLLEEIDSSSAAETN